MRGDVFRLRPTPHARGHEQRGERYAIVVQASQFDHLSTWLVVPTSTRAKATVFRPEIEVPGRGRTLALCDGLTAVDPQARLSDHVGWLAEHEMVDVDIAIQGLLDLDHGR
jgi:mRNA interferase MazF